VLDRVQVRDEFSTLSRRRLLRGNGHEDAPVGQHKEYGYHGMAFEALVSCVQVCATGS